MAKTKETLDLEKTIFAVTNKLGVFGCFEVTIGLGGKERVDYLTYDTKGIWRCYEIKSSKTDFHSKAKKTFVGHYNYFVLTKELYELVKDDIPNGVGVYANGWLIKRAKKQSLTVDETLLKESLIRSLSRENVKFINSNNPNYVNELKRKVHVLEKENSSKSLKIGKYRQVVHEICQEYGLDYKEIRNKIREIL